MSIDAHDGTGVIEPCTDQRGLTMCAAANPAIASRLQSNALVGRVAELESFTQLNTPPMPDAETHAMKEFPLINRYHAAWLEHGTRITQRQSALNMHVVSCGVMFGYFFASNKIPTLLLYGVTVMTLVTTAILWMHHRIMQRLCSFMSKCEKHAQALIRHDGGGTDELFYFHAPKSGKVTKFHGSQRLLHRVLLTSILWVVHLGADILAYASNSAAVMICAFLVLVVTMLTYIDLYRDRGDDDE